MRIKAEGQKFGGDEAEIDLAVDDRVGRIGLGGKRRRLVLGRSISAMAFS